MSLDLVSRKEIALALGVHYATVHNWEKKGILQPFCTINGRPRYQLKNVIASITKSKGGTENPPPEQGSPDLSPQNECLLSNCSRQTESTSSVFPNLQNDYHLGAVTDLLTSKTDTDVK